MSRIRYPHGCQLPSTIKARQLFRIPTVRLHPVSGLGWHQAGRDHLTGNSQLRELPVQHVPGRTSPPVSATATAIVSAWTSRPTKRTLDISDQFLSYAV